MSVSRKEFLRQSLKAVFIIGAGNSLQTFAADRYRLPSADKIKLRFALVSDGHYGQPNTNYSFHHDNMIQWLNNEHAQRQIDFTVVNGDLFHNIPTFLPELKTKWDELKMPYFVSHGNHDQIDAHTWKKTWNLDWHYAFEKANAGFLVLNTANEKGDYICPDINWTKKHLQKHQSKKHLFVFMHITPFKWTKGGIDCPELIELFDKQSNLKAIFHGHDHDQDDVKENNGKYYFFDSHIAGDWGTEYRGYRIVEILDNDDILTYQMNPAKEIKMNEKNLG